MEGAAEAAAAEVCAALERAGYTVATADPGSDLGDLFEGYDRDIRDFVVGRTTGRSGSAWPGSTGTAHRW